MPPNLRFPKQLIRTSFADQSLRLNNRHTCRSLYYKCMRIHDARSYSSDAFTRWSLLKPIRLSCSGKYGWAHRSRYNSFSTSIDGENCTSTSLLTPSNTPISTLLSPTALTSLRSLPETQTVLDIIDGKYSIDNATFQVEANQLVKQSQENIERSRNIFHALPELHSATFLLEASLFSQVGQFEKAVAAITRYQHTSSQLNAATLQFVKAKLLFHSGEFIHALSEYEDMLECMEEEAARQMQSDQQYANDKALPVLDGAAILTGVGLSKFMIQHTSRGVKIVDNINQSESIEAIQTATEMLLESRKDALMSPDYSNLALDLGLAAVISLNNFGIVQCLIYNKRDSAIKRWKQGFEVLNQILYDAANSAMVIPNHKYQCIQSMRARLYCNIASVMLNLDGNLRDQNQPVEIDEEVLKESSSMAKKALEVYDEILNGPQVSSEAKTKMDDGTNEEYWNEILKNNPDFLNDEGGNSSTLDTESQVMISPLWFDYHRAESARALGLVAMCYYHAGAAVTAEGLLQSALDASSSYPFGQCLKNETDAVSSKGVSLSSPNLALVARDVRLEYGLLCDQWDKRTSDADKFRSDASRIETKGALKDFGSNSAGLVSSIWLFSPLDF